MQMLTKRYTSTRNISTTLYTKFYTYILCYIRLTQCNAQFLKELNFKCLFQYIKTYVDKVFNTVHTV